MIKNRNNRIFMKDEAYDKICNMIILGKLKPYERLNAIELSKTLGISRTPVREALLKLENDGFVISKPNSWTIVAPIKVEDYYNLYSIVAALEKLALEQAFLKINNEDIKELEILNEKLKIAIINKDCENISYIDDEFHKKIVDLSSNHEISALIETLKKRLRRVRIYLFGIIKENIKSYEQHKNIINFIKEKNLEKAIKELHTNWQVIG